MNETQESWVSVNQEQALGFEDDVQPRSGPDQVSNSNKPMLSELIPGVACCSGEGGGYTRRVDPRRCNDQASD
jgi:hypothetical protein